MNDDDMEDVSVPRGAYIGWGTKPNQFVKGNVLEYEPSGATDFNGDPCPQLEVELTEKAASFNKEGEQTNHQPGDVVVMSCGQVSLKRAVKKAELKSGDLVKITLENLVKASNGTVKEFGIKVKRGAGQSVSQEQEFGGQQNDDPPF